MSPDATIDLDGSRALVAGASGVLGSAIVDELAGRGARVVAAGRDETRLDDVDAAAVWRGDLTEPGAPTALTEHAVERLGGLDVVVNAAGVVAFGPVPELDAATAERLLAVNAQLPMLLAAAAFPHLPEGGVFVNLTGIVGEQGVAGMAAYCGSKAAAARFMQAAAREGRRVRVRMLDARPPHTETGLATRPIAGTAPTLPPGLAPEHVARVIVDAIADGTRDLPPSAFAADA